jgi:stage II sporulation protein R
LRSKVFKGLLISAVVTGTLTVSALMTMAVTAKGTQTVAGTGAILPAEITDGRYADAYQKHELIRFHVIANSDSEMDQALKRKVRDLVVQQMTPEFAKAKNLTEARAVAKEHLAEIQAIAGKEVEAWGKSYPVTVQLGRFDFPVKSYGEITLSAGNYEAVRVVIGKGQGANWWCVLFPPLCFVDVSSSFTPRVTGVDTAIQYQGPKQPNYQVRFKFLELLGKFDY